jgi:hypothetical protein
MSPPKAARLLVRMPQPLKAALEEAAKRAGVSMNAELIQRLERSFERLNSPDYAKLSTEILKAMRVVAELNESDRAQEINSHLITMLEEIFPLPPGKTLGFRFEGGLGDMRPTGLSIQDEDK